MFTTSGQTGPMDLLNLLKNRITLAMNEGLSRTYTKEEIISALEQMHPTKALGPDGMPSLFF